MKQKTRKLLFVLMTISCIFTNISIGFSTWIVVESQTIKGSIDIFTEDAVNLKDAFSIKTKNLVMGKYLYEEDGQNSLSGTLRYDFSVNLSKLPDYLINEDGSCDLKFTGDLSFSDFSQPFFTSEYISAVYLIDNETKTNIAVTYENSRLVLEPFELSVTASDNDFSIAFTFTQKCILDNSVKSVMTDEDNFFKLSLLCGGE